MEKKYLKLGEKASVFHDPSTGVLIRNHEVVEVTSNKMKSKKIQTALRNGHISPATVSEFEIYHGLRDAEVEKPAVDETEVDEERKEMLMKLSKAKVLTWMETEGFDDNDITEAESIQDKEARVNFILKAEEAYK